MLVDGKDETQFCPSCGRPTKYRLNPEWLLGTAKQGNINRIIAALLIARQERRGLSIKEVVDAVYDPRTNKRKPPENPDRYIRVEMARVNKHLNQRGWAVAGPHMTGNGFWLVPVEVEK